jgi:hypothetical protein
MLTHSEQTMNEQRFSRPAFTQTVWFNAVWFQSVWFCAVLGRENLLPATLGLLLAHLILCRSLEKELLQLSTIAFIGIATDAILSATGVYQFDGNVLIPLWLCALWVGFATTLNRSLSFFGRHSAVTIIVGAVGLPLNYWAGERLGAVSFGYDLIPTLAILAVVWAVIFPLMFKITAALDAQEL